MKKSQQFHAVLYQVSRWTSTVEWKLNESGTIKKPRKGTAWKRPTTQLFWGKFASIEKLPSIKKKKKKLRSFLPTVSPKKLVVTIFWGFTNSNLLRCNICSSRCSKLQPPRIRRRPFSWFERVKSLWLLYYWCNRWSNSSANASDFFFFFEEMLVILLVEF